MKNIRLLIIILLVVVLSFIICSFFLRKENYTNYPYTDPAIDVYEQGQEHAEYKHSQYQNKLKNEGICQSSPWACDPQ